MATWFDRRGAQIPPASPCTHDPACSRRLLNGGRGPSPSPKCVPAYSTPCPPAGRLRLGKPTSRRTFHTAGVTRDIVSTIAATLSSDRDGLPVRMLSPLAESGPCPLRPFPPEDSMSYQLCIGYEGLPPESSTSCPTLVNGT